MTGQSRNVRGVRCTRRAIDLGGANDTLTLAGTGVNQLTLVGVETLIAGGASDDITLGEVASGMTFNLGAGSDILRLSGNGANNVTASGIESIIGGVADDTITLALATVGSRLDGGNGDDSLIGSNGADILIGGNGADRFIFRDTLQSSMTVSDTINDFVVGQDKLVFEGLGNGTFSIVSSFSNTGNAQATYAYNGGTSTGTLLIDSDGNGAADMKLTLLGGSAAALSASDFQWT